MLTIIDNKITHGGPKGDGALGEGGGELAAPPVSLPPRVTDGSMDQRFPGRVDERGPLQKPERRQSGVVSRILGQIIYVSLCGTHTV